MTVLRPSRRAAKALHSSPRSARTAAQCRLAWLRNAAAAGTLTLAMLHGTPDAMAQVASDPAGDEFRVNTETEIQHLLPSVAMDADGDFVIAWHSDDLDGSSYGVFGQRYAADGTPQNGEFQVNTFTSSRQQEPSVAMDDDGSFVVAWESRYQDGDGSGIFAQRYAADGTPQGPEFQVNTFTSGTQRNTSVAIDADGDFVIVWQSTNQDGDGDGIFAQRYDAAGTPQGAEFQVNTTTTSQQRGASVAMDDDGNFVVAWVNSQVSGIFAQRYAADGTPQGAEFQVNTFTSSKQNTSMGMDADGDFVIAWESYGQDGDFFGIFAQRYAADGTPQGPEFQVNTVTASSQQEPSVAMDAEGDFIVAWRGDDADGAGVLAQRYATDGTPQGAEFQVNTTTTDSQEEPSVAIDADGDFVVAWQSYNDYGDDYYNIFAQRYATADAPAPIFDLALATSYAYTAPGEGTLTATVSNVGDTPATAVRVKIGGRRDVTTGPKQILLGEIAPEASAEAVFTFSDADPDALVRLFAIDLVERDNEANLEDNLSDVTLTPPDLTVALTPDDAAPITVPSTGGSVWFTGAVTNLTTSPVEQEIWVVLLDPDEGETGVFGPQPVRLGPGQSVDRRFEVIVGPDDAAGTYTSAGRVGAFPDDVEAEDSFTFEKLGGDTIAGSGSAALYTPGVGGPVWGVADDAAWAALLRADAQRKAALAAQAEEEVAALAAMAESEVLPEAFALVEPYPNPMSGLSSVRFELPEAAEVTVTLYDVLGRTVAVLAQGTFEAGRHEAVLDGRALASGTYVVRFEAGEQTLAKPVTVLRAE